MTTTTMMLRSLLPFQQHQRGGIGRQFELLITRRGLLQAVVATATTERGSSRNRNRRSFATTTAASNTSNSNNSHSRRNNSQPATAEGYKIVIVGSGPSGCYTAKYLLAETNKMRKTTTTATNSIPNIQTIDILDRLPTPYGLVRNGVAPDHPEVKNVQEDFDQLFSSSNDASPPPDGPERHLQPLVRFFGNVLVGDNSKTRPIQTPVSSSLDDSTIATHTNDPQPQPQYNYYCDVGVEELRTLYDIVVLAYGCEADRDLKLECTSTISHEQYKYSNHINNKNNHDNDATTSTNTTTNTTAPNTKYYQPTVPVAGFSHKYVEGVLSARQFVNWYNGHPDYDWVTQEVATALHKNKNKNTKNEQHIVILGHGNVALDCARILAKARSELTPTDLTTRALNILHPPVPLSDMEDDADDADENHDATDTSKPTATTRRIPQRRRTISIVGRRGHLQGAYTIKEVRELTKLVQPPTTDEDMQMTTDPTDNTATPPPPVLVVRPEELEMGMTATSQQELQQFRPKKRIHKLLSEYAAANTVNSDTANTTNDTDTANGNSNATTHVYLRFLLNPIRYEKENFTLTSIICERTKLVGDDVGYQRAVRRGRIDTENNENENEQEEECEETIQADLCLVSIGYKGLAIDRSTSTIYNEQTGTLHNTQGRVTDIDKYCTPNNTTTTISAASISTLPVSEERAALAPVYVAGWLKRGPSGIIGTNIGDAKETVQSILEDLLAGDSSSISSSSSNNNIANKKTNKNQIVHLEDLLKARHVRYVTWDGYTKIDHCESYGSSTTTSSSEDRKKKASATTIATENDDDTVTPTATSWVCEVEHHKRHPDQPREKIVDREMLLKVANQYK